MGKYFKSKKFVLHDRQPPKTLFLCEGESEAEYVDAWLTSRRADSGENRVLCFRGLSHIKAKISYLAKEPELHDVESICIFLDAEDDFDGRLREVERMLRNLGFPHSSKNEVPWVESADGKTSCVFISPNMASSGRIENIVMDELRSKKDIFECIENFGKCSTGALGINFDEKNFVHSYIVINKIGMSLGAAFQKGLLNQGDPAYADLNQLLEAALT